jgi:hypothetical protein
VCYYDAKLKLYDLRPLQLKIDNNCQTFLAYLKKKDKSKHDHHPDKSEIDHLVVMSYCSVKSEVLNTNTTDDDEPCKIQQT